MKHYKKTMMKLLTAAVLLVSMFMTGCTSLSEPKNSTPSGTDAPAESDGFGVYVKLERDDASSIALHGGSSFTKVCENADGSLLKAGEWIFTGDDIVQLSKEEDSSVLFTVSAHDADDTLLGEGTFLYDAAQEINGQQFTPYTGTESGQAFADYAEKVRQADTEFCAVLDSLSIPYFAADWSWNNGGGIVQDYTNYVILGNYGDSVTLGQYQGTKYVEANFTLVNTLYELYPDNMLDTAAERTHDGYSAIQIPEDISGTYAIRDRTENGTARCFALLIVR